MTEAHPVRCGIIGFGRMGRTRLREIKRHPDAEVVLIAESNPDHHEPLDGIRFVSTWQEVIASDLDAVFVCTPNHITKDAVIAALDAGRHVFSEKPPGRSVADIMDIIAAESQSPGLKLKFGLNHRYHAGIEEAKRIVESGRLGEILWLRGIYGKSGEAEQSWRNSRELCGGGILLDQGIHMIDLFRHFCGDFLEVKSMVSRCHWENDVEDNAFALLRDQSGRVAMLHSSSTQWRHRFTLEVYLSGGSLSVNGLLTSSRSYGEETITIARKDTRGGSAFGRPREEVLYFDHDPSWEMEVGDFIRDVTEDRDVQRGTSRQALEAMKLVFAIYDDDDFYSVPEGQSR